MDTIKFANGETHNCTFLSTIPVEDGNMAIIAINDASLADAASLFSDSEKTARIEWGKFDLVNYTELLSVTVQPYGIQVLLKGGHNEPRN